MKLNEAEAAASSKSRFSGLATLPQRDGMNGFYSAVPSCRQPCFDFLSSTSEALHISMKNTVAMHVVQCLRLKELQADLIQQSHCLQHLVHVVFYLREKPQQAAVTSINARQRAFCSGK